jgi:hypothetical protein
VTDPRPRRAAEPGTWEDVDQEESELDAVFHRVVAWALLIGGQLLTVATIVVVAWSRYTRDIWGRTPLDDEGFTTAELPNIAMVLLFCFGMALPFIVLPVGSTALAFRDGDRLTVRTVLGRRTVDLTTARLWRATFPGRGPNTELVVVRSRWRWVILTASESWDDTDFQILGELNNDPERSGWHGELRLYIRGWILLALVVMLIFAVLGVGWAIMGIS